MQNKFSNKHLAVGNHATFESVRLTQ